MRRIGLLICLALVGLGLWAQEKKAEAPKIKPELATQLLQAQVKYFRAVAEMREIEARYPVVKKEAADSFQHLTALKALAEKEAGEGYELDLQEMKLVPRQPAKAPAPASPNGSGKGSTEKNQ